MAQNLSDFNISLPDHVEFIVPRVDVEHGANAHHVVLVIFCVFNVLVPDGDAAQQLEVLWEVLAELLRSIESIHQQRLPSSTLVSETMKHLDSATAANTS